MTEKTDPVEVQWALQGKTLGRAGARVLACSTGKLSMENFTELIGRFSLGTPEQLPQVSVSYLPAGNGPDRVYYLGMAIHKWAADVQTDGGELLERDDDNRPVAVTTYFCVPYQPLADAAVSYQAMYQEFGNIRLDTTGGPPLEVEFPVLSGLPALNALAVQSAGRLLTGRPVCVLGADSATVAERLEFIGAVAALLPYGFRTRLTAATWVRPTHRDHRFRLFFSAARRDADPPDDVIHWGHPEQTALTPDDDVAYTYDQLLADTVGQQLKALARLTKPRSFSREEVLESLDEVGLSSPEPDERGPEESASRRTPTVPVSSRGVKLDGEQILRDCASNMQPTRLPDLYVAITRLTSIRVKSITDDERRRYQEVIREQRLFRHDATLGGYEAMLREALFKVAFIPPLSYQDYCVIEDSLGPGLPDLELLLTIANMKMSDIQIRAVVYAQLRQKDRIKLDNWYKSRQVDEIELLNAVAGPWHRPLHALYASRIASDYMNRIKCDPYRVRDMLQRHSFLARRLQKAGDGHDKTQVAVLISFLQTAYPEGLSAREVEQVVLNIKEPPSPALLAAVLLLLDHPEHAQLAREAYVFRTTLAMKLEEETLTVLRLRLARPGGLADGLGYPPRHGPGLAGAGS